MQRGIIVLVLLFSLSIVPAIGQAKTPIDQQTSKTGVSLDFENIELADLVKTISELTGRNFVYDDTLKGTATIISPDPMSLDEAYILFLTVLNVKGFTVVPSGKVFKIVKTREATENNLPLFSGNLLRAGEQFVTRIVRLRYAEATDLADNILKPLIPKSSYITAYAPTNTLLISDSAANISRLVKIIAEIDTRGTLDQLEIIPLQYANVDDIAELCNEVLTRSESGTAPRRQRQTADTRATSKVIPYSRTNSLVVMATDEDLQLLRPLIERLDRQPTRDHAHINVYYLENADAETLAQTLSEIVSQSSAGAKSGSSSGTSLTERGISITADKPTNALIINATPEDFELIKDIIGQLDIKRKQVFVEALIMELSMGATKSLGASLQGAIATGSDSAMYLSTNLNSGSTTLSDFSATDDDGMANILGQAVNGILLGGFFSPISVAGADGSSISVPALSALIQLSQSDTDINILSAPRLLTSDNEEAEIVVGSNVPIITGRLTNTTSSDSLAQSVTVERKDVALTLRFTPQITEGDLVRLNIYQEITDLASTQIGDVDQVGPTLTKRLLRNTVLVENGRTVVLGGLIGDKTDETVTKVPGLGDLPLIGWLFKQKSTTQQKTNLLVFITPHILKDAKDLAQVTRRNRRDAENFRPDGTQLLIPPLWVNISSWMEMPPTTKDALERSRGETMNWQPIGQILQALGVDEGSVELALDKQLQSGKRLGEILLAMQAVSTTQLAEALARQAGLPFAAHITESAEAELLRGVPIGYAKDYCVLPLTRTDEGVTVMVADPYDNRPLNDLTTMTGGPLALTVAPAEEILRAINRNYEHQAGATSDLSEDIGESGPDDLAHGLEPADLLDTSDEAPIIRFVNSLVTQAYKQCASDIHIEPFENELVIRYRIDGLLYEMLRPPHKAQASITSRIKIMANLNIAEKRLPQDGRFRVRIAGKDLDVRVSTLPTAFGERVVLRLLDQAAGVLSLEEIGMPEALRHRIDAMLHKSHGIFLVTGPTGSGKTTTLYAALTRLNSRDRNIITVEDPIEYQLDGVGQIQVNPKIDLTFAAGLRSILRQDPDTIMVGEIRDGETAEIAVQSALTGHMVFSTLHTNDAAGALTRLVEMGIEPFLAASSIVGILAQRLVRRICPDCRQAYTPSTELLQEAGLGQSLPPDAVLYHGTGCEACMGIGYRGRTGIYEMLTVDETIRDLLLQNKDAATIKKAAIRAGMQPLREAGLAEALAGKTSLEEVLRVTQEDN